MEITSEIKNEPFALLQEEWERHLAEAPLDLLISASIHPHDNFLEIEITELHVVKKDRLFFIRR